jgi:hypothetical protein
LYTYILFNLNLFSIGDDNSKIITDHHEVADKSKFLNTDNNDGLELTPTPSDNEADQEGVHGAEQGVDTSMANGHHIGSELKRIEKEDGDEPDDRHDNAAKNLGVSLKVPKGKENAETPIGIENSLRKKRRKYFNFFFLKVEIKVGITYSKSNETFFRDMEIKQKQKLFDRLYFKKLF